MQQSERELERLSLIIKGKDEEIVTWKNRFRDTEGINQNYQVDFGRQNAVYEQNMSALRGENEELKRKIHELGNESNRRLGEAAQEIERLGQNLRKVAD